jgi:hypothetical protein
LSFITFDKAKALRLPGRDVKLSLVSIGGQSKIIESKLFRVKLFNVNNEVVEMEVYGIQRISSQIQKVDVKVVGEILGVSSSAINRPVHGEIHLLIGQQSASLHPVRKRAVGNLVLMENAFGLVVSGSHPQVATGKAISLSCLHARDAVVMHATGGIEQFFEIEGLGVQCEPQCGGCKCGQCHPGGKGMTLRDEKEYQMIERGLHFDIAKGRWIATYPWVKPPEQLPHNRCVALATLKSTEKRLAKNRERAQLYNEQIHDMLNRKVAREVTEEELARYGGPRYYLSHFEVMNPRSKSTPCRIVFNSSARFKGSSLNDYLAKGPSMLNKLLGVLLRFREGKHAFMGDIAKMYHSIDMPLREQMTHLFLWRDMETERKPSTFAMTAVNFGDKPSATIAQVALRKSAEEASQVFPGAARILTENSYMDDIPASTDTAEQAIQLTKDIEAVLKPKGFQIKEWVFSGSESGTVEMRTEVDESATGDKERVLGVQWDPGSDMLMFDFQWPIQPVFITKRSMLSVIMRVFDPLGLLTPITVRLKMMLRRVWSCDPKVGWDDVLPQELQCEWNRLVKEMNQSGSIAFSRSITPHGAIGSPVLVVFSDGSINAYGAVAYARWEVASGGFVARIIAAKCRMAPLKTLDIVRIELCGAVLSSRLRATVEKEMNLQFAKVIHVVDSEIVKAMVHKQSHGFNTFAANRIGEIHQTTAVHEWQWVAGKPWCNVADITTRGCPASEVAERLWQEGPEFLQLPENEWPTKKSPRNDILLPERKQKFVGLVNAAANDTLLGRFDLRRFSKWRLLIHATARVLNLYKRFRADGSKQLEPTAADLSKAEAMWVKEAQAHLNLKSLKRLQPAIEGGLVMVGGRTERWMQATWNRQKFVLLPKNHEISWLIARFCHEAGGHLGLLASVAKVRSTYWIMGIHRIMRTIISKCVKCRKKLMSMCGQIMSPLPIERLKPSPPFTNICIDYFGPYAIRGEVQKRIRGKGYGVILTCMSVRAVYIDLAPDLSTDAFLQLLRRFASLRGWPQRIFSDGGTQLVGASRELNEQIAGLDWKQIQEHGHRVGVEWKFSPGDAPWYNGTAESLIKSTKRALDAAIGDSVLTFSELQTCLLEAAQLVNQRPIGVLPSTPDEGSYLCPNDLLLGRASTSIPQGPFKERTSRKHRLDFIQAIVAAFWKRWSREVFPSLILQPKWHTERRNLQKGDVVLVQDSNAVRGKWKMALVKEPLLSDDSKVRRVIITYRTIEGSEQDIERAVQRLILLVPVDDASVVAECTDYTLDN